MTDKKRKTLYDLFVNLKNGVLGTNTSKIDSYIDKKFDEIDIRNDKLNRNLYIDVIKQVTNKSLSGLEKKKKQKDEDNDELFDKILDSNVALQNLDDTNRIQRYQEYISVLSKISHVKRALKVLTDNIVAPDNITKESIDVLPAQNVENKRVKEIVSEFNQIQQHIKLDNHLNKIIFSTLLKGDFFIEILHSPKGENAHLILQEDLIELHEHEIQIDKNELLKDLNEEDKKYFEENFHIPKKIILDVCKNTQTFLSENEKDDFNPFESKFSKRNLNKLLKESSNKKEENVELKDIFLTFHKPEYVVRLETERFRSNLGFLVFPKYTERADSNMFANYTGNNANLASSGNLGFIQGIDNVTKPLDELCKKILDTLQKQIENNQIKISKNKDLKDALLNYLTTIKEDKDLRIRYVSSDFMVHFRIDVDKYDPYGESMLDSILFESKLYIALKTAMLIKQINSSVDRRVLSIEVGLSRNAKNVIEQVKEKMRKRKISIDTLGTIDSIPSQIKTFEDIYLPMLDGKKFIEFDNRDINGTGGQDDVEKLKFLRDNIVSNLYVPPAHIGIEENVSNRALLSQQSAIFARTIISMQKQFNPFIKELLSKIYLILHPEDINDTDDVVVTLPSPKSASYEHEMEFVEQVQRLLDVYKQLGIPLDQLKRKYLPDLDWDEIDNLEIEEKIDNLVKPNPEQAGMGGMSGPGMY